MCDYSLELYQTRPARAGETYETHRFPTGTIGFAAPGDRSVAVCMAYDTRLQVEGLPPSVRAACGVEAKAEATFARLESGPYHDGLRFANGAETTLQQLGHGVSATVTDALLGPRWIRRLVEAA